MKQTDLEALKTAIQTRWPHAVGEKAKRYVGKFFDRVRVGERVVARVEGNHGTYTVSLEAKEGRPSSAGSCYIGRDGYCHHCHALAATFLNDPQSFKVTKHKRLKQVQTLADLENYLGG